MQKIRTNEELYNKLDSDLAWRKKEINYIINSLKLSRKKEIIKYYKRIGIIFLYAHWEGYIKNASMRYLNLLRNKAIPYKDLKTNLMTVALKRKISQCSQSEKTSIRYGLVEFLRNNLSEPAKIPYRDAINTNSNLSSSIFYEILFTLGLDMDKFELKWHWIDHVLLKHRNNVAHGHDLD